MPTPDQPRQFVVVRRFGPYPSAENYLTNVPLWMYHVNGGSGVHLYPTDASRKSTNTGVAFSPDGSVMYVSTHAAGYTGENLGSYQIVAFDRNTGEETTLTSGAGGGLRPDSAEAATLSGLTTVRAGVEIRKCGKGRPCVTRKKSSGRALTW